MSESRIRSEFDASTTAQQAIHGVRLDGRRAVVTGGASGLGISTARALALAGADVTLAVRDMAAGNDVARKITEETGNTNVRAAQLDLLDPSSIRAFVQNWSGPLHILVNNAGIMATPPGRTPEGWDLQFATNHIGHFMLTNGLHEALRAAKGARVVSVSSSGHQFSPVVFEDIHFDRRPFDTWLAYAQSKTANILFAVEANRRWAGDGITVNASAPGHADTSLHRHVDEDRAKRVAELVGSVPIPQMKTADQGAATAVWVATSPQLEGIGGRYFENCNEAGPHKKEDGNGLLGTSPWATDPEMAKRLWDISSEMVESLKAQA